MPCNSISLRCTSYKSHTYNILYTNILGSEMASTVDLFAWVMIITFWHRNSVRSCWNDISFNRVIYLFMINWSWMCEYSTLYLIYYNYMIHDQNRVTYLMKIIRYVVYNLVIQKRLRLVRRNQANFLQSVLLIRFSYSHFFQRSVLSSTYMYSSLSRRVL